MVLNHRIECLILLAVVEHFFDGEWHVEDSSKRGLLLNDHELVPIRVRQWPHKHAVDHTKNRSIGADPKRQRQNGHDSEAGVPQQDSHTVASVLQSRFDQPSAAHISTLFFELFDAAESPQGLEAGLSLSHASRDIILSFHVDVETQFFVQITLHLVFQEKRAQGV
jgi:hypothetical protein